jgi:hypothetical protein
MQQFNKAMIVEVYSSEEITMADIDWVIETLRICSAPPFRVILVKSGSYFLSDAAKMRRAHFESSLRGKETAEHAVRGQGRQYLSQEQESVHMRQHPVSVLGVDRARVRVGFLVHR